MQTIATLANDKKLPKEYRGYDLNGDYAGYRECLVRPTGNLYFAYRSYLSCNLFHILNCI